MPHGVVYQHLQTVRDIQTPLKWSLFRSEELECMQTIFSKFYLFNHITTAEEDKHMQDAITTVTRCWKLRQTLQRLFTQLRIIFQQKYDIRTYGTTNEASGNITRNTAEQHNLGIDQIGAKSYEAQNPQLYMVQQHEIYQTETY